MEFLITQRISLARFSTCDEIEQCCYRNPLQAKHVVSDMLYSSVLCTIEIRLQIVEAFAEHDFTLRRLIEMVRATEQKKYVCATCQFAFLDGAFDTLIFIGKLYHFTL